MGTDPAPGWNLYCPSDAAYLKALASEHAAIGTPVNLNHDGTVETYPDGTVKPAVEYYQRDKSLNFDPVYQEPTSDEIWRGPYRFPCTIEFEEADGHYNPEVEPEGVEHVYDAICTVTPDNWKKYVILAHDEGFKAPHDGDVVTFFNGQRVFVVEKVEQMGYIATSLTFTNWKLSLKSRSSFKPERLLPPKLQAVEEP